MLNIIEITDFSSSELDIYARLNETQLFHFHEPQTGLFIAESPKVIERALNAGYIPISFLLEKKHIEGEAKDILARCKDVPIYTAALDILTKITGFPLTRGVLCAMYRRELPQVEDICKNASRIAVLENVMNPTNVGAIFRSAAGLHIDAVLLTPGCSDPLYRRSIRVSMGTVFQIPWTFFEKGVTGDSEVPIGQETTLECTSYLKQLNDLGFRTVAMALTENSIRIDNPILQSEEKLAIVLGTEGDGLASQTIASCDYTVRIPMSHEVDSLNVAAASAVAFWELRKR